MGAVGRWRREVVCGLEEHLLQRAGQAAVPYQGRRGGQRLIVERAYPRNLIHYNKLDRGGHFAAWEQPDLFAAEMRAAFRSLR